MVLLRRLVGDVLRRHRQRQSRTLREVSAAAQVSLGYLSEVERGRKEASSELLASICAALGVSLADVLREVSDDLLAIERRPMAPLGFVPAGRPAAARAGARVGAVAGVAPLVPGLVAASRVPARSEAAPVARLSVGDRMPATPVVAA
jgi:transcriptional regulator with XRE-family HTH domain